MASQKAQTSPSQAGIAVATGESPSVYITTQVPDIESGHRTQQRADQQQQQKLQEQKQKWQQVEQERAWARFRARLRLACARTRTLAAVPSAIMLLTCMQEAGDGTESSFLSLAKLQTVDTEVSDIADTPWVRHDDPEIKIRKLKAECQDGRAAMMGIIDCFAHELLVVDVLCPTGSSLAFVGRGVASGPVRMCVQEVCPPSCELADLLCCMCVRVACDPWGVREADVMAAERQALLECGREHSHNITFSTAMLLDNPGCDSMLSGCDSILSQGTTAAALPSASPQALGAASGRGNVLGGRGDGGELSLQTSASTIVSLGKSWALSAAPSCLVLRGGGRSSSSHQLRTHRESPPLKPDSPDVALLGAEVTRLFGRDAPPHLKLGAAEWVAVQEIATRWDRSDGSTRYIEPYCTPICRAVLDFGLRMCKRGGLPESSKHALAAIELARRAAYRSGIDGSSRDASRVAAGERTAAALIWLAAQAPAEAEQEPAAAAAQRDVTAEHRPAVGDPAAELHARFFPMVRARVLASLDWMQEARLVDKTLVDACVNAAMQVAGSAALETDARSVLDASAWASLTLESRMERAASHFVQSFKSALDAEVEAMHKTDSAADVIERSALVACLQAKTAASLMPGQLRDLGLAVKRCASSISAAAAGSGVEALSRSAAHFIRTRESTDVRLARLSLMPAAPAASAAGSSTTPIETYCFGVPIDAAERPQLARPSLGPGSTDEQVNLWLAKSPLRMPARWHARTANIQLYRETLSIEMTPTLPADLPAGVALVQCTGDGVAQFNLAMRMYLRRQPPSSWEFLRSQSDFKRLTVKVVKSSMEGLAFYAFMRECQITLGLANGQQGTFLVTAAGAVDQAAHVDEHLVDMYSTIYNMSDGPRILKFRLPLLDASGMPCYTAIAIPPSHMLAFESTLCHLGAGASESAPALSHTPRLKPMLQGAVALEPMPVANEAMFMFAGSGLSFTVRHTKQCVPSVFEIGPDVPLTSTDPIQGKALSESAGSSGAVGIDVFSYSWGPCMAQAGACNRLEGAAAARATSPGCLTCSFSAPSVLRALWRARMVLEVERLVAYGIIEPVMTTSLSRATSMYLRGGGDSAESSSAAGVSGAPAPPEGDNDTDSDDSREESGPSPVSQAVQRARVESTAHDILTRMHGAPRISATIRELVRVLVAMGLSGLEVSLFAYLCGQPQTVADLSMFMLHSLRDQMQQERDTFLVTLMAALTYLVSACLNNSSVSH